MSTLFQGKRKGATTRMAPIPVYKASPINAAKASGVTPQTAPVEGSADLPNPPVTTTSSNTSQAYPPAQPGAMPSLPVPTGTSQPPHSVQPTPTRAVHDAGPPPPQPGAAPVPPRTTAALPQQPPQTTAAAMPPQMSYPPPSAPYVPLGSSTTTAPLTGGPRPTQLYGGDDGAHYSHPPGYQQNANAGEFSSNQRAAHQASIAENPSLLPSGVDGNGDGVWNAARKWATAAGDSLAAAENEVWKRINKD